MITSRDAVVWVNSTAKEVRVRHRSQKQWDVNWNDPIGAAYTDWRAASVKERIEQMLELAIGLAMSGFDMMTVMEEFAQVEEFALFCDRSEVISDAWISEKRRKAGIV